jgi:Zn-dependent metalloprotease
MEVFRGENREEKVKTRFADNVRVTKNRLTKIPERVMEMDVYPTVLKEGTVPVTEKNAESTFKEFLKEHKELFEVEPEDLKMVSAKKINNKWYVKYRQYYKGIPVYNVTVGLDSSENGKVSSYASNYQPNIEVPTEPRVKLEKAVDIAKETYAGKDSQRLKKKDSILIIYPEKAEDKIIHHLAWKFMLAGERRRSRRKNYQIIHRKIPRRSRNR